MITDSRKLKFLSAVRRYVLPADAGRAFSMLAPYMLRNWKPYGCLFFFLWIDIGLTLGFAWFYGAMTDAAILADMTRVRQQAAVGVGLLAASLLTTYGQMYLEAVALGRVKYELQTDVYRHVLLLPALRRMQYAAGDLLSRLTNDLHGIEGMVGRSFLELLKLPLIYLAVFVYLCQLHWQLALLGIAAAPAALALGAVFGFLLRRNSRLASEWQGRISVHLNESLHGWAIIRSFSLERRMLRIWSEQTGRLFKLELASSKLRGTFAAGGDAVSTLVYLACLGIGAQWIAGGQLTVGTLLTFISLISHLVSPLTGLAAQWAGFQRSVAAVERLRHIVLEPKEPIELQEPLGPQGTPRPSKMQDGFRLTEETADHPSCGPAALDAERLSFSYDGQQYVFENFDLHVPAGTTLAIVGRSGAGKTTLMNLLQGLYAPEAGTVRLNGRPLAAYAPTELRCCFAYVPQDTFLFGGTVKDNLLLARPDASEEELQAAAEAANLHDVIKALPDGYDTEIGEGGVKLSGGQRQRLAIARAMLKNAPILLLDEATSALDPQTERELKEAMQRLMSGRTTILIAHRLSTVQSADRIIVLEHGRIVQDGRHEELIAVEGPYRQLHGTLLHS
ncbi:ABC transporter ATP-binding protein [Paenibacillus chartarius]|uniref:ABC transporter ATP-binding protein n=1 Tax=Paenibacillus chartarius TaxID=747481 RepID=A0ABV6DV44_9BACL